MANLSLFRSRAGALVPATDARNHHAAPAYAMTPRHALAQLAATGSLNATFYASAESQLTEVIALAAQVEPRFVAQTAVYARERAFMKDMPALLCAVLSTRDGALLTQVFPRVMDNARMVRNFVQIMRSGQAGRKSMGTLPKRLVIEWLNARTDEQLFDASVGNDPSLVDIVKMVHPRPANPAREALYGYLLGSPHNAELLPAKVRAFEAFKAEHGAAREDERTVDRSVPLPKVPFEMLTALDLTPGHWKQVARDASWQMTRMNLNTFARHGVFQSAGMERLVAERLRDEALIKRARVLPYQLMIAYLSAGDDVPAIVRDALQDAMEIATRNVPRVEGKVYVFPDVSGSMQSVITGVRKGASSKVRCIDVAALVAATVMRKNPEAEIIPFGTEVCKVRLNPHDSVMTNAAKLAAVNGGGTNCSAPLAHLNAKKASGDLIIYVSDNESWVDAGRGRGTATMAEWTQFRQRNPRAKMVCIDLQPYTTTQAKEREDIVNVGGFSDAVFEIVGKFAKGELSAAHWVAEIEAIKL